VWNQGKEDWVKEQYIVFLVKREESRDFDVFFVFGREEKSSKFVQAESRRSGSLLSFWSRGCLGLFIAPTRFSRRRPFKSRPFQKFSDRVDLDTPKKILTSCF